VPLPEAAGPTERDQEAARYAIQTAARMLAVAAVMGPMTVLVGAAHMLLSLLALPSRPERGLERFWFGLLLKLAGARVLVRGWEHVRADRSYVIMPNHRSWMDVPALHWALGHRDIRWVGKKEIVPVPVLGWAFGVSRHIKIDRHNRERGIRAIRQAARVSGGGVSIVIFPEGTRSVTAELLPFKKGGFHLALDTGLEILPVAISGTERIMRKREWTLHPGIAQVTFCPPVARPSGGKAALPELMQAVRERIQGALSQPMAKEVA
jgi:1-acyl-sn-glycerol-3-phosphate acyltransferase